MRIAIEGNIGCGKTTLIRDIARRMSNVATILEPVEDWSNWLTKMYADPKRWSFAFNLKVILTLAHWPAAAKMAEMNGNSLVVFERSPLACKHIFCCAQFDRGELTSDELDLLDETHGFLGWEPDIVIYLYADPDVCDQRMRQRDRTSERSIDKTYIKELSGKYEELFGSGCKTTVIRIDVSSSDKDAVSDKVCDILEKLREQRSKKNC